MAAPEESEFSPEEQQAIFGYYLELEARQRFQHEKPFDLIPSWPQKYMALLRLARSHYLSTQEILLAVQLYLRSMSLVDITFYNDNQLLLSTCLWVASKYEEERETDIYSLMKPELGITQQALIETETKILEHLDYKLNWVTSYHFVEWFALAQPELFDLPGARKFLFRVLELSNLYFIVATGTPSLQAAAAVWLTREQLGLTPWTPSLEHRCRYSHDRVGTVVNMWWVFVAQLDSALILRDSKFRNNDQLQEMLSEMTPDNYPYRPQ